MAPGWHLYALTQPAGGPVATTIEVRAPFRLVGAVAAPAPRLGFDRAFGIPTEQYDDSVRFTFRADAPTSRGAAAAPLRVAVGYQTCDDRVCLPPATVVVSTTGSLTIAAAPRARHALPPQLGRAHLEVEAQLVVHLAVDARIAFVAPGPAHRPEPEDASDPAEWIHLCPGTFPG